MESLDGFANFLKFRGQSLHNPLIQAGGGLLNRRFWMNTFILVVLLLTFLRMTVGKPTCEESDEINDGPSKILNVLALTGLILILVLANGDLISGGTAAADRTANALGTAGRATGNFIGHLVQQ